MAFAYGLKYSFSISNNKIDSEAFLANLSMALVMNIDQLIIFRDSQVVYSQVTSLFEAKEDNIRRYYTLEKMLVFQFRQTFFENW